jgi:hypothetical protein
MSGSVSGAKAMFRKIFHSLKFNQICSRLRFALNACLQPPELCPLRKFPALKMEECVHRYLRNFQMAQYYSELIGARYFHFLQPYANKGRKSISKFEIASDIHKNKIVYSNNKRLPQLIDEFYAEVIKQKSALPIDDLRDIFQDYQEDIYFDNVHLSDIGQDIIAKKISEKIISEEMA